MDYQENLPENLNVCVEIQSNKTCQKFVSLGLIPFISLDIIATIATLEILSLYILRNLERETVFANACLE